MSSITMSPCFTNHSLTALVSDLNVTTDIVTTLRIFQLPWRSPIDMLAAFGSFSVGALSRIPIVTPETNASGGECTNYRAELPEKSTGRPQQSSVMMLL